MYRKITIIVGIFALFLCGFTGVKKEFSYEYEIVLNSNDNKDVIRGYLYKEHLINEYNILISGLDESLISDAIISNIDRFALEGSYSEYINGKIVVFIGNGKGDSIGGSLKKNTCDNSNIRVKFFFSKFFVK